METLADTLPLRPLAAESAAPSVTALLAEAEAVLSRWLLAHGLTPTEAKREGYRLLALHAQGARHDPTFNACRESCRELIYQCNMALAAESEEERQQRLLYAGAVLAHLRLFIEGKLEVAGLGTFCCASRPLREKERRE
jgi:hypothetical protein